MPEREPPPPPVVTGPGPRWLRIGLAGLALVYYGVLVHHPSDRPGLRAVSFFTQATSLFSSAAQFAIEFRIELWPCGGRWEPADPRPYFPIEPDDKESRFQRFGHFYEHDRAALPALDRYVWARHAAGLDDGVVGPIGGFRLVKVVRPLPAMGDPVERYHFDPFAPIPASQRRDIYTTPAAERKRRCTP